MFGLTSLLAGLLSVQSLHAQSCNLLDSSGEYNDYSSYGAISTLCAGNSSGFSDWEAYQCEYILGRNETCWPRRHMSACAPGSLRGVAFLFHGYSACPDQYKPLVPLLQAACYHVYLPTTVGHGLGYCAYEDDVNSTGDAGECTNGGYNLTELPERRGKYIDWIDAMNAVMAAEVAIVKDCETTADAAWDEDGFDTLQGGLSLGASLSGTAGVRSYLANMTWTKQVLMSPFLGVSYDGTDDLIYKCTLNDDVFRSCLPYYFESIGLGFDLSNGSSSIFVNLTYDLIASYVDVERLDSSYETLNLLIRDLLTYIVETNDSLVVDDENAQTLLDTQIGWGDKCQTDQSDYGRGGFCNFNVRHLVAAHSLGSYVLENVGDSAKHGTQMDAQFIMVERDGSTRNGLVASYAQLMFEGNQTAMDERVDACLWLISAECQEDDNRTVDNTCGVPHSSMAVADNIGSDPYYLYWNETYMAGFVAFATDGDFPELFNDERAWDGGKTQCIWIDMYDPPPSLIADVPQKFQLVINLAKQSISDSIKDAVLDKLVEITNVPKGILELTAKFTENFDLSTLTGDSDDADSDDNYVEVDTVLTEDSASIMSKLLNYDALSQIADYAVEYASIGEQCKS